MYSRISAVGLGMAFGDAGDGGHDLPGRAVAALEGVLLDEGAAACGCSAPFAPGEALDGGDRLAHRCRQGQAGEHAPAADVHRAGAALALVAALLGAGEAKVLAQGVEQGGARVQREPLVRPLIVSSTEILSDRLRCVRRAAALRHAEPWKETALRPNPRSRSGHCANFILTPSAFITFLLWRAHPPERLPIPVAHR